MTYETCEDTSTGLFVKNTSVDPNYYWTSSTDILDWPSNQSATVLAKIKAAYPGSPEGRFHIAASTKPH